MAEIEKVIAEYEDIQKSLDKGYGVAITEKSELVRDTLKLLEEYKQLQGWATGHGLTKCKDCKHRGNKKKCIVAFVANKQDFPFFFYDNHGEWFCADGKRRTDDA